MSTFTKNYYHPKNEDIFLTLRWEQGYKHVEIFHGDELIKTIYSRAELIKGVVFEDEVIGKVKLKLSTDRPMKIVLKVNGKKYKTVNLKTRKEGFNVAAVRTFFGLIAFGSIKGLFDFVESVGNFLFHPIFLFDFIFLTVATLVFLLAAILVKQFPKIFYIGAAFYFFSTLQVFLELFNIDLFGMGFIMAPYGYPILIVILILVFRISICLMLIYQFKGVRNVIRRKSDKEKVLEVID